MRHGMSFCVHVARRASKRTRLFRQWSLSAEATLSLPGCTFRFMSADRPGTAPACSFRRVPNNGSTECHPVPQGQPTYLSDNNERVALLLLGVGVVRRASS